MLSPKMVESDTRRTFEEILSFHGLEKSDLENSRPTEALTNELAVKLENWEDCQRLCREGFRFSDAVIAAIARQSKQERRRKIAVMRTWKERSRKSATYLNLAQALYQADFDDLVERLCVKCKEKKLQVAFESPGHEEHKESGVNSQYSSQVSSFSSQSSSHSMESLVPESQNQQEINNVVSDTNEVYTESSITDNKLTVSESPSHRETNNVGFDTNEMHSQSSATNSKLTGSTDVDLKQDQSASSSFLSGVSSLSSGSSSSLPDSKTLAANQSLTLCSFSETMSEEAYYIFLKGEGLPLKDCAILKQNGLGPKMFVNGFSDTEIESTQLNFTIGGKLVLKRLVKELSQNVLIGDLIIKKDNNIGNGAFGSVFKGTWKQKPCAVKVLHALGQELVTGLPTATKGSGHEKALLRFEKECQFMKEYNHPNIVCCYDTLIYPKCNFPILVMELMDTNLGKFIGDDQDLALEVQISISRDVAAALTFLHGEDIVHRDLCGDNILLNYRQEVPIAKISDFGMSRVIMKYGTLTHSMTAMGRRGFIPPEGPLNYDSSLDIFMFGVVMIMIAERVSSIDDKQQRQKYLEEIPQHHPLKKIISWCTNEEKEERPTTAEVYEILMKTNACDSLENECLELYVGKGSLAKLIGEKVIRSSDLAEVPVSTLEKKGSVVGLFFSAHWCPPSREFTPLLVAWYNNFKERPNGHLLNIVFISSDTNEGEYLSYFDMMPWYSLHYNHRKKKNELTIKFGVSGIPTLVFVDGKTGKLITRDGRKIVVSDPDGNKFPWSQPSFSEVIADCKFIGQGQEQTWSQLKGQIIGFLFSLPWSKYRSIKAFSSELAMVYNKLKESGKKFEIVYVNHDKDKGAWQEYVENIPWMALPFGDKHEMDLVSALDVTEIPALIMLDENGDVITKGGYNSVRSDPLGLAFPWYVNSLTEETADDIPATPSVIWFIPSELKHIAIEILEQIAKRYLSKCAEMKTDVGLLFYLSWRSRIDDKIVDYIRSIATLPDIEPLLIILDMFQKKVHICDTHEVTIDCVKTFINDYFRKKLVGKGLVPMTVSQRRHIEADVLRTCLDGVSTAMTVNDVEGELFGTLLIQYNFASETVLSTPTFSPEISSDFRINAILRVVESTIREASTSREARVLFNILVEVIAEPLGCMEIAQNLVTLCKMKDPTYVSPIKSPAKPKQETCPANSPPDTKIGYDFEVKEHHISLIEYVDAGGTKKLNLYDQIAPKWRKVGEILGLENCVLDSIRNNNAEDHNKAVAVLQKWMVNANSLPRHDKYPMTWTGLVGLLKDCELGILAEKVEKALNADVNSVKGNMS